MGTRRVARSWVRAHPLDAALVATTVLFAVAFGLRDVGFTPQLQLVANAMLHGRLDIAVVTPDSVPFQGHYYLTLAPLPSVLLIPAVAVFGVNVPLLVLTLPCVAATVVALWKAFAEIGVQDPTQRLRYALLTLAGTDYVSAVATNVSNFAVHTVAVAFLAWALLLALCGERPVVTGLVAGCALLSRNPAGLAIVGLVLFQAARATEWRWRLARGAFVIAGASPAIAVFLLYNLARFHSAFDTGTATQILLPQEAALRAQGVFSVAHLPTNLYYLLVAGPVSSTGFPWVSPNQLGMGMLWVSPWLLLGIFSRGRTAMRLAVCAIATLLPGVLYYGLGAIQFGFRYALDALPFTAALAVLALEQRGWRRFAAPLLGWSAAVNMLGAAWLTTIRW